jgi:hypothetical protein
MSKMRFNQREWVNGMVTGAITGAAAGAVGVMFVSDPPFVGAMAAGGIVGLVPGLLEQPIIWLLDSLRGPDDEPPANPDREAEPPDVTSPRKERNENDRT